MLVTPHIACLLNDRELECTLIAASANGAEARLGLIQVRVTIDPYLLTRHQLQMSARSLRVDVINLVFVGLLKDCLSGVDGLVFLLRINF